MLSEIQKYFAIWIKWLFIIWFPSLCLYGIIYAILIPEVFSLYLVSLGGLITAIISSTFITKMELSK